MKRITLPHFALACLAAGPLAAVAAGQETQPQATDTATVQLTIVLAKGGG